MEQEVVKPKDNIWKTGMIVLAVALVISIGYQYYQSRDNGVFVGGNYSSLEQKMCLSISGTPAWADEKGNIVDYGFKSFNEEISSIDKDSIVQNLITSKMYYLYNPECVHCLRQQSWFGEAWNDYKNSTFAINCVPYW